MNTVTINQTQQVFVIPCGEDGYTTAGFDWVMNCIKQIATRINGKILPKTQATVDLDVNSTHRGTIEQYEMYQRACKLAGQIGIKETWFKDATPKAVCRILESYRKSGAHIRVFVGDKATGRDWMEECDVMGRIGRSTGIFKIPLLIQKGECGGPGLLDDCIVKLMDVETRKVLWQHPQYHLAAMQIVDDAKHIEDGYTHAVEVNGETHARFKTYGKAAQFVAFISGECMEQPE